MQFDPHAATEYRPLFSWAGSYFSHLRVPVVSLKTLAFSAAYAGRQTANATRVDSYRDAWLTVAPVPVSPPVCAEMLTSGAAQFGDLPVYRGPHVYGLAEWYAITLKFDSYGTKKGALPTRLQRRYGSRAAIQAQWPNDAEVRMYCYDVHTTYCSLLINKDTGEVLAEIPTFLDIEPQALRAAVIQAARASLFSILQRMYTCAEYIGVSAMGVAERRAAGHTPTDVHTSVPLLGDVDQRRQLAQTGVRGPEYAGLVWLQPRPPITDTAIYSFNHDIARFAQRLFAFEVCRVQATLQALSPKE